MIDRGRAGRSGLYGAGVCVALGAGVEGCANGDCCAGVDGCAYGEGRAAGAGCVPSRGAVFCDCAGADGVGCCCAAETTRGRVKTGDGEDVCARTPGADANNKAVKLNNRYERLFIFKLQGRRVVRAKGARDVLT